MTPLASLLTAPTPASVLATAITAFTRLGIPAGYWNKRGTAYGFLVTVTSLYASVVGQLVTSVLTAPFLPLAVPPWNAILALFVYGVKVNPATYATGLVTLTNPGGSLWNRAAGTVVFGNSQTQQTYTNTDPFSLAPNASLAGVAIRATTVGSVGSATAGPGPGSVDTVITPLLGVTVVNPAPVLGLDADSPALVRTKCLAAIAARSFKGPLGAYEYAVATATNGLGQPVNVNRWSILPNPSTGVVVAYLAAPGGAPTADDVAAVQARITAVAQPGCVQALAVACTVLPLSSVPGTIVVWTTGTGAVTTAAVEAAIDLALEEYPISGRSNGAGGFLFAVYLYGKIAAVDPSIYDVTGLSDVPLSPGQIVERTSSTSVLVQQGAF